MRPEMCGFFERRGSRLPEIEIVGRLGFHWQVLRLPVEDIGSRAVSG